MAASSGNMAANSGNMAANSGNMAASATTTTSTTTTTSDPTTTGAPPPTSAPSDTDWAALSPPGALSALRYRRGSLSVLDQRLLPARLHYEAVRDVEGARAAIASMKVRGAPAIALVGCLALAVELWDGGGPNLAEGGVEALEAFVAQRLRSLEAARPTGSNMQREARRLQDAIRGWLQERPPPGEEQLRMRIIEHLEGLLQRDVAQNRSIGAHGARHILGRAPPGSALTLLTHCNTGGLATAGYGTALGIVWALHAEGRVGRVFCTETRPCNQGARLTALELQRAGVPATLITDSAAASAIRDRGVHAVVVGADRVAANGDTANKVGTYPLALAARQHRVPLYVAAPSASCDPSLPSGGHLPLEERPGSELGAAPGIDVWNPAFDVTPQELITGGIVTEFGVFAPSQLRAALEAHGAL